MIFDEVKIVLFFDGVKEFNVDFFFFDDGWFGNKYLCNNDCVGFGDWQVDVKKFF